MTVEKLIDDSIADVKEVFAKLDINVSAFDFTGRNEAMFNSVFIKSFLGRFNDGDFAHFKELRDNLLSPVLDLSMNDLRSL